MCLLVSIQACENGRGAVLLSVARGKVSEGVDFGEQLQHKFPLADYIHSHSVIQDFLSGDT